MAVFFVGVSFNLVDKDKLGVEQGSASERQTKQQEAASDYNKDSWLKTVNGLLAPFAATITPKQLVLKNCSQINNGFILNEQSDSCKITVLGFSETFKKLSLKPDNRAAKLKITYKYKSAEDNKEEEFSWPTKDPQEDQINFVILGNEELVGQTVATVLLECINCINQRGVKITFD